MNTASPSLHVIVSPGRAAVRSVYGRRLVRRSMELQADTLPVGCQFRQWTVSKKLGEGAFGSVYEVQNVRNKDKCAMKTEPTTEEDSMIKMEVAVLKTFRNSPRPHPHICEYVDSGITNTFRYVVMKLAGQNLADIRKSCPRKRLSESTTARLGIQCIRSIEDLHAVGFIHRDIKPPNYAIGRGKEQRIVFMLDFGLARQFVNREGALRPPRQTVGFRGTVRYASLNAHKRRELGRHDDLWSMLYMLVELQMGRLPWRKLSEKDEVAAMKKNTSADKLLEGMAPEYHDVLNELQGLHYRDAPNYEWFCDRLTSIMTRKKYAKDDPFDWEAGGKGHESFRKAAIALHPFKRQKEEENKVEKEKEGEKSKISDH